MEFLSELHSQLNGINHCFHIVPVYVKDRAERCFGNIGTIGAGAGIQVVCGKSNLVVYDHMNGSTGTVTAEFRHLQQFIYNSLPCNGCIAMNEDGSKPFIISFEVLIDLGPGYTFHDGIDGFEMRGIWRKCKLDLLVSGFFPEFDLVLSGINNGPNLGTDVIYSGTVAGARQALIHGISGISFSLNSRSADPQVYKEAARYIRHLVLHLHNSHLGS